MRGGAESDVARRDDNRYAQIESAARGEMDSGDVVKLRTCRQRIV